MVPIIDKSRSNPNSTMLKRQTSHRSQTSLHMFSDASEAAYSAAVNIRHEYSDGSITARLIGSKTRLSPLKAMSIPRLELMGAVIGLRLTTQISSALEIPMPQATFWVDSMNVVFWIQALRFPTCGRNPRKVEPDQMALCSYQTESCRSWDKRAYSLRISGH